jgi:hypothetical protein
MIKSRASSGARRLSSLRCGPRRFRCRKLARMTLTDCLGIGLTLSLMGAIAVGLEYSPLARTRFARNWIYSDAPGGTAARRRTSSLILSWCALFLGHAFLIVGAIWTLGPS